MKVKCINKLLLGWLDWVGEKREKEDGNVMNRWSNVRAFIYSLPLNQVRQLVEFRFGESLKVLWSFWWGILQLCQIWFFNVILVMKIEQRWKCRSMKVQCCLAFVEDCSKIDVKIHIFHSFHSFHIIEIFFILFLNLMLHNLWPPPFFSSSPIFLSFCKSSKLTNKEKLFRDHKNVLKNLHRVSPINLCQSLSLYPEK